MLTASDRALAIEAADHYLEARRQHNSGMARHLPVADPIEAEQQRQRKIINAALVMLGSGNTNAVENLLKKL